MATLSLLQRFADDELAAAPALVARVRIGAVQLLATSAEPCLSPEERVHHAELHQALQRQAPVYESTFLASLRRRVDAEMNAADHGTGADLAPSREPAGLELMDEARVEIDIEISRAMQLIDSTAEWELHELQTFTSTLAGGRHVTAESNPFRPLVYAMALWDAACAISDLQPRRALLLRTSAGVAAGLLKNAWAAASTRLESQGVQPGIYRTVVLPSGAGMVARGDPDASRPLFPPAVLPRLPQAAARPGSGSHAGPAGAASTRAADLATALFESLLSDSQLPDAFRNLVSGLRGPGVRAAGLDPDVLDSHAHPLWRLIDRVGEVGAGYPRTDDPRRECFLAFASSAIAEIAPSPAPDTALLRRLLNRIDGCLAEQLQAELRAARGAIDALALVERRDVLEQHLVQRLTEQMASVRTSPAIRRFVAGTWTRVIAADMLAHGDQSEAAIGDWKTLDDLLWSLRIPDHPQSRQRLVALLPGLLQRIRAGMEAVAFPPEGQQQVLGELMNIHTEALRPGARQGTAAPSTAPTPEEIVRRLREEVVPEAPTRRGFGDSMIDVSSMETVPAEHLRTSAEGDADDAVRRVEDMRIGDRQRIFLRGKWTRVQLLWRSDRGLFFVFAGESPSRAQSITRRALERLGAAGLVQPLEVKPLVQRAVDRLLREASP